jgi:hypothetical protein
MSKKKLTKADREFMAQALERAAHTRALAEKAQAELDRRKQAESD